MTFPSLVRNPRVTTAVLILLTLAFSTNARAADPAQATQRPAMVGPDQAALKAAQKKAIDFLRTTQAEDGSWTSATLPGISALVADALIRSGVGTDDPTVKKALANLEGFRQPDGGIYDKGTSHKNYETSICLLAFNDANTDGRYDELVAGAQTFLKTLQWGSDGKLEESDPAFGGAGYGGHQRPDLSNTQFFLDALLESGLSRDDPAVQNALVFVSRCQNLETEHNTTPFASKVDDGGFYYTVAGGGNSQAGMTPNGGLRSYGSMTYAGLKSMIHAGLTKDDQRVKAAFDWIKRFYTLEQNPGMGEQGLYYYYHTFAKTLDVLQLDYLEDAEGQAHDWRKELAEHLIKVQKPNGSWLNDAARWYEGDPNLVTGYTLLALSHCEPKRTEH